MGDRPLMPVGAGRITAREGRSLRRSGARDTHRREEAPGSGVVVRARPNVVCRRSYDPEVPTPVLATKLFPPTPRSELVARPGLAEQLDGTLLRGHRLTLISAPAGFGKSTLLSDWAARRADADVAVAWLSLDEGDNALSRFLAHLWAALPASGSTWTPRRWMPWCRAPVRGAHRGGQRARTRGAATTRQPLASCSTTTTRSWRLRFTRP